MTQRTLPFDRPATSPAPRRRRRRRPTLREEFDQARLFIAKLHPAARLESANRELLQQRRHD